MFILEMHSKELPDIKRKHIAIEPDEYWGDAAIYNIRKEGLDHFLDLRRAFSDQVLPGMYYDGLRIQYAYIDTTKQFDVVMQDFYYIDKILEKGGVVIFDDTGGFWPGIQRVVRYVATLPHYKVLDRHNKIECSFKMKIARFIVTSIIKVIPFKKRFYPTFNFKSDSQMNLDFSCVAFQKIEQSTLRWDYDKSF
jgi:hypothetical protein